MNIQKTVKQAPYQVDIKVANLRYFEEFWRLKCAPDLMERELFPNAKEMTESMTAFHAVRKYISNFFDPKDPEVTVFCVGDGRTPRTGALFAFRTAWTCYSIDPIMKEKQWNIDRLVSIPSRIEDQRFWLRNKSIIVAVHSHADVQKTLSAFENPDGYHVAMVAMPCCIDLSYKKHPDLEYRDWGCWSPENVVRIWGEVHTEKW